ncbi:DNA primase [Alkalicoccus luteus]|uniref:DNA primase n=1 Tax=Alkalicoccus luteus TaxID=1237094 RepID=A0A969PNZ2_9BACI|nr:DNA primase [Alkalicoccus luteus]NJP37706.1 DNA primase [Alkalicoccus luteus]
MSRHIPEETVEAVRKELDIVDVISEYVDLKKQGRNFSGLCPFHGEKTPSFSVSQEKQLYHCFGCGAGGNVVTFVMEYEGLSFPEAVQQLAGKTSVEIPEEAVLKEDEEENPRSSWYKGHELAAKLYHHLLLESPEGKRAREYLRARGFTRKMIETFQIGFAPESWNFLTDFLRKRGFEPDDMAEAGLLARKGDDGRPFDRFRGRIMFPIWDKRGKVIAFGGRVLDEGSPKYLNSPESDVFNKGRLLYHFHGARPSIRRKNEAVLFEGYVDVISAYRAGIEHGTGSLGTALSQEQARMIRRNADKVILCFDGDNAGRQASWKNADILQAAGLEVAVAMLPQGMDPDDYIQHHGPERFAETIVGRPLTMMEFKSAFLKESKNMDMEADQLKYVEEMLKEIAALPKAIEQDHYLRQLQEEFSLSYDVLKQELGEKIKNTVKARTKQKKAAIQTESQQHAGRRLMTADERAESDLISFMMHSQDAAAFVEERVGASFQQETFQALAALLYSYYAAGNESDPAAFISSVEDPGLKKEAAALAMKQVHQDLPEQVLEDYADQILHRAPIKRRIEELQDLMKRTSDVEELKQYINQLVELKSKLHS